MASLEVGRVLGGKYTIKRRLGAGGASTVYEVVQAGLNVSRALKVLDPHVEGVDADLFKRTFGDEIRLLSHLSHQNLAKILDYGEEGTGDEAIYFFVMEFANSGTLSDTLRNPDDAKCALQLFAQVLNALSYLHERHVLHSDIKGANILIHKDPISGALEAKLADLGVAKPLGPHFTRPVDLFSNVPESTYFWGTAKYAPPYAIGVINEKVLVKRSMLLEQYFPHYDLFCLGATLAEAVSNQVVKRHILSELDQLLGSPNEVFHRVLPPAHWQYLLDYIRVLLTPDPSKGLRTTAEAKETFARIDPRSALPALVPEITSIGSEHLITHGSRSTRLSDRAYRIVSHPCFHRLQRLNQLNLVEMIYPDARQPRLSHCLETFELAKEVTSHLLGDGTFRLHVGSREIGLFLCAALLHDIGHYPLAHTIEDLRGESPHLGERPKADYEMAEYFLTLKLDGWEESIADVLKKEWDVDVDEITRIIGKIPQPKSPAEAVFRKLLDGAIDIDKLAYLSGDSRFTGVAYGKGIDVQALISSLLVLSPGKDQVREVVVGLAHKGVNAAEGMVVARYHMFSRVYWHHTNRALMAMVRYAMRHIFDGSGGPYSFNDYINETLWMSDVEALRVVSQRFDSARERFRTSLGEDPQNPLSGLLDGSRTIYKRLVSFSKHPQNSKIRGCHSLLAKADFDTLKELRQQCREALQQLIGESIPDSYVLFDVPRIDKESDALPVLYVRDPHSDRGVIQLNEISHLVGAVSNDFETSAKKSRVFIHPNLRKRLREKGLEGQAARAVEDNVFAKVH